MSIFCSTGFCCWALTNDASYKWLSEILQQWWHLTGRQWFTQFTPWWQTVTLYMLSKERPWPWRWLFGYGCSSCQSMDGCGVELDCWFKVPVHLHTFVVSSLLICMWKWENTVCELEWEGAGSFILLLQAAILYTSHQLIMFRLLKFPLMWGCFTISPTIRNTFPLI